MKMFEYYNECVFPHWKFFLRDEEGYHSVCLISSVPLFIMIGDSDLEAVVIVPGFGVCLVPGGRSDGMTNNGRDQWATQIVV